VVYHVFFFTCSIPLIVDLLVVQISKGEGPRQDEVLLVQYDFVVLTDVGFIHPPLARGP